ncbi:MAG: metallophosphoesterase [Deltaproteobacteria bacterium]|nr:metallophosphoesterase [Deltaproteobacteria bacterium]
MKKQRLIVIADSHLGTREGDLKRMLAFIETIDPKEDELLFLGDLFHIWAAPLGYHTDQVSLLLSGLMDFKQSGGRVHLVMGNRDVFFTDKDENEDSRLPFTTIRRDFLEFRIKDKKILFIHGDTVNSLDTQYLKWRKTVRSRWFKAAFSCVPSFYVKKIMFSLEDKLKNTNLEFRKKFPQEEWQKYLLMVKEKYQADFLLIGHFHPKEPILTELPGIRGIVVPDWHDNQNYYLIDQDPQFHLQRFS